MVIDAGTPGALFRLCLWFAAFSPYKLWCREGRLRLQHSMASERSASPVYSTLKSNSPDLSLHWTVLHYPAEQSVASLGKWPRMTKAKYWIWALPAGYNKRPLYRLYSQASVVIVCLLSPFMTHKIVFLLRQGVLFTTVICNQQTRSPLNPLVSSVNVVGEMVWLMLGLFCLRDKSCAWDFLGPVSISEAYRNQSFLPAGCYDASNDTVFLKKENTKVILNPPSSFPDAQGTLVWFTH